MALVADKKYYGHSIIKLTLVLEPGWVHLSVWYYVYNFLAYR